jgi:tRNA(Ile2) C34 agmatinyltransferase TiaS
MDAKSKIPRCPSCRGDLKGPERGKWWCRACDRVYGKRELEAGHV